MLQDNLHSDFCVWNSPSPWFSLAAYFRFLMHDEQGFPEMCCLLTQIGNKLVFFENENT